jgi:hypothetical protein
LSFLPGALRAAMVVPQSDVGTSGYSVLIGMDFDSREDLGSREENASKRRIWPQFWAKAKG